MALSPELLALSHTEYLQAFQGVGGVQGVTYWQKLLEMVPATLPLDTRVLSKEVTRPQV